MKDITFFRKDSPEEDMYDLDLKLSEKPSNPIPNEMTHIRTTGNCQTNNQRTACGSCGTCHALCRTNANCRSEDENLENEKPMPGL